MILRACLKRKKRRGDLRKLPPLPGPLLQRSRGRGFFSHALRILLGILVAGGMVRGADEQFATLRVGTEYYTNVTVTSVSATEIFFIHSRGGGNAKLKNLDPALQKMFHFDPAKAAAKQSEEAQSNARYTQGLRNAPTAKREPAREPESEVQQEGPANGIPAHPIYAKSFINQPAPRLQVEK